jgi:Tol biopolymer transport system component
MTPDARRVAFNTPDGGGTVFVKDTQTGTLTKVSPDSGAVPQVIGFFGGALSDDGNKVLFITRPQQVYVGAYRWVNVVPARLMLRDLTTGSLVTLATDNGNVADGEVVAIQFAMSPDGQRVAFISSSATLVAGDTNGRPDLLVRNLADGTTVLASSTSSGVPATAGGIYWRPAFVSNSQLAFGTGSSSSLGERGLYLKDLTSGALQLVLRDSEGGSSAVLSGEARVAVFNRTYSGFSTRVVARDLGTGVETLVSSSASGTPSNGSSTGGVVSRTGSHVAFGSSASNLATPRPPTGVFQIYVKSISAGAATLP